MAQNFLVKSARHKVKVIFISRTGERATPFVRQAAKNYWAYASFAFALWREEEATFWWNMFGVESAPAIVFLRDPGVKPVVYHGSVNNLWFLNIMGKNKHQDWVGFCSIKDYVATLVLIIVVLQSLEHPYQSIFF
ncbi:unnamed protein product [Ilex paraguariensis]|uniref:Thioredoxin-like protein n=1 Tax=Ilex paraguariensis TaxID=185542 RepID=A0ABC8R3J7_9AQUA